MLVSGNSTTGPGPRGGRTTRRRRPPPPARPSRSRAPATSEASRPRTGARSPASAGADTGSVGLDSDMHRPRIRDPRRGTPPAAKNGRKAGPMPVRPSRFAWPRAAAELCTDGKPVSDDRQPQPETTRQERGRRRKTGNATSLAGLKARPELRRSAEYLEEIQKELTLRNPTT